MMDWTDRHCRVFHRLLTRRARLYTEMLTSAAIVHGDRARLLAFDASEHAVALQLGGSDPRELADAARITGSTLRTNSRRGSNCRASKAQSSIRNFEMVVTWEVNLHTAAKINSIRVFFIDLILRGVAIFLWNQ